MTRILFMATLLLFSVATWISFWATHHVVPMPVPSVTLPMMAVDCGDRGVGL